MKSVVLTSHGDYAAVGDAAGEAHREFRVARPRRNPVVHQHADIIDFHEDYRFL